jgi:membrane-bound lytic murein transglycosylase B
VPGTSVDLRAAAAALLVLCLAASCSDDAQEPRSAPTPPTPATSAPPSSSPTPTPSPTATPSARPEDALELRAGALAARLDEALATVRAGDADAVAVQQAAEFQQLAVRRVARSSETFRQRVLDRLEPADADLVGAEVRAAAVLGGSTAARPDFAPWRIVKPRPARELLGHYRAAERELGVPWTYLAAINLVETRMGRIRGLSTAGAQGPMQFLPTTWARYGGSGDIDDPHDAIFAAARLLRAHGAPGDMAGALWHYNPSQAYVQGVTEYARTMQQAPWTYRAYWHWRVLYRHVSGFYVLPQGYPKVRPVLLESN